jgi:hypothetical protein
MLSLNPNFRELLQLLNSGGVKYLVVGGYAVNFHGHHRNTKDRAASNALAAGVAEQLGPGPGDARGSRSHDRP